MFLGLISLCGITVYSIVFPTPNSYTPGWHPVSFEQDMNNIQRVSFIDENMVLWKGDEEYHIRPDVCPHQGSKLSVGKVEDNCITCPYHGLKVGPYEAGHPDCRDVLGRCVTQQGIIWWSRDPKEPENTIPYCKKLDGAIEDNLPLVRFSTVIENGFSDCFKNGMDFHHAAFVHKNTFGNYAGEPEFISEIWNTQGEMEGNFAYGSNDNYAQFTGGTTDNSHVYCKPSTTYNIVGGTEGKFMIIHLAMRALTPTKTLWYLTSCSNFVPNGPIGRAVLDRMVRKVALEEDGKQLSQMATDDEKLKHSYKFQLPLDTIYGGWNTVYDKPEDLEKSIMETTDETKLNILCQKLCAYNHTVDLYQNLYGTEWELVTAKKYNPPGSKTRETYKYRKSTELTSPKKGSPILVTADLDNVEKNVVRMSNLRGIQVDSGTELKLPFKEHVMELKYISENLFIRRGLASNTWQVLKKVKECEENEPCSN